MLPTDHINTSPTYTREATTNRLLLNTTDYTYDTAGQLISAPAISGYHSMMYTAEGYLRSIDAYVTGSYLYNALGERTTAVHNNTSWNQYVYLNGQPMADLSDTGVWTDSIYANGQKIARVANDPVNGISTHYFLADQLGTTQVELDEAGAVLWQGAFTPFGQEIVNGVAPTYLGTQPNDGTNNRYKFTGKERDKESGFDYFGARYYGSGMGRWTSPDWSAKQEPVPYGKLEDPQSLNLYGYVGNNPIGHKDSDGHTQQCDPDTSRTEKNGSLTVLAGKCHEVHDWSFQQSVKSLFSRVGRKAHTVMSATTLALIRTYQTYTRPSLTGGKPYSGRTSGTGTPEQNIAKRAGYQPKTGEYGPPELDKSSTNANAIRGREQQLIEGNGGAQSVGGNSGNAINGVSPNNPNAGTYCTACETEFPMGSPGGLIIEEPIIELPLP